VIYLAAKYVNETTPEPYQDWLKIINDSLTENIEESNYPRPELQKAIHLIEKNLVTPEERYWMIEEYNAHEREKKKFDNGVKMVAKNLLAANVAMEIIVKTTDLTVAEIENLSNEDLDND
jgi:hypothetical protein